MMEKEYSDLLKQEYDLVKHGGLSAEAVEKMTQDDRNMWIKFLNDDRARESKAARRSGGSKAPHFPTGS